MNENAYAQARLREKLEMNPRPGKPCDETGHLELSTLQDRKPFSNHGHVAFVEIAERRWGLLTGDCAVNQLTGVAALLDRDLRDPGQRPAVLVERCGVSDDENLGMAGRCPA